MRRNVALALAALAAASPLCAQDLSTATPTAGNWRYAATADGSQATYVDAYARPQLWIHCTRATRRVSLAKPAAGAAPLLNVWTSTQSRNLAASFNPATARLTIELAPFDPLLDALASSRGRVAIGVAGQPPLVAPPWAEIGRVVEDCRA